MRLKLPVKLLLAVLLLIGVAVSMWLVASHRKARERRLAGVPESRKRLIEMLGSSRPFEGRLLGMSYTSFDPVRVRKPLPLSRLKEALALATENRNGTEAEHLPNVALVYSLGNELDLAIQNLARATVSKGAQPWMWSDLSAFYMERFRKNNDSQDLLKALDSSAHVQDSPSLPLEARFNYALSLEKLSLFNLAKAAWKDYAARDRDSGWSAEAKDHLRRIEDADIAPRWERAQKILDEAKDNEQDSAARTLVREFPQFSREYGEETLLGQWAANWQAGNIRGARHALSLARHLGHWLDVDTGEQMLGDTVAAIDRAASSGGGEAAVLARGHILYQSAQAQYKAGNYGESTKIFEEAERCMKDGSSPFYRWALLRIAICRFRSFRYKLAAKNLEVILSLPNLERYPALAGTLEWGLGIICGLEEDPASSLVHYQRAVKNFGPIGNDESYANVQSLIAECLSSLGNILQAWSLGWQALQEIPRIRDIRDRHRVLWAMASLAEEMGSPESALLLMDEALELSPKLSSAGRVALLRRKAVLCARTGLVTSARVAVSSARRLLLDVADVDSRFALSGDLFAVEGEILALTSPKSAQAKLSYAIEIYQSTSYDDQLGELLFQRAKVEVSLHQLDLAERDLARAIGAIEGKRNRTPGDQRDHFLDERYQVYAEMAKVQLMLGRPSDALRYVEQARSRSLLDRLSGFDKHMSYTKASEFIAWIQDALDEKSAIVEYAFAENSSRAWLIRRHGVEVVDLGATARGVEAAVNRLRQVVDRHGSPSNFRAASSILFDMIMRPLVTKTGGIDELVIVPDRCLYSVSFPALFNDRSGRFLIEDFRVAIDPSAAVYALAKFRKRSLSSSSAPINILAVGGPLFDRRLWRSLTDLADSAHEASEVAVLYPHALVLTGPNATPAAFLRLAPRYEVVHLAVHALTALDDPSRSFFVLSPFLGDSGALYGHDISRLQFRATRVVVLAACNSLESIQGRGLEGVSLATPFLQAGVPTAIGSLWRINDDEVGSFMRQVHELLRNRVEPGVALRKVQVKCLRSVQAQSLALTAGLDWASFELFGA